MLNDDVDVNIFDADESNTELKMDPILTPTKHSLMPQHFTSEEEQAVMALVVKLSPIRSINSPSLRTTPLKSAEAYSFMENYLSPLPCRPVPMKSKSSMPSMQWPLEDSILDANFSLVDDKSFPLYKSPVATRPLSHIVASPGRRGTPGCTKSLDFSDTKALDFGTPFSNFSTSPPSPFPAFTLPNKQPTSVTPAKSPVKSFEVKSFEEAAPEPYRSPGSFRLKIDPQSPVNMAKTAEINNVLRTPTPHQVKAPVKFSRKSSTPKRRRHRRSGNSKKKRMKRSRTSIGSLRTQSRKRSLNVTSPKSRHRSACNCKKSKCLKLYCECFAALVMCGDCKCSNCENTEQFADVRNEAIRATKERNPNAFAPKINSKNGRHLKGCHCKKSGCKKKYCECFQANIYCGGNCKCQQCENVDAKSKREGAEDLVFLSKEFQFNCSEDRAKKSRVVTA